MNELPKTQQSQMEGPAAYAPHDEGKKKGMKQQNKNRAEKEARRVVEGGDADQRSQQQQGQNTKGQ